jgi:hypothetical protein
MFDPKCKGILGVGKTANIPEEIAKECVKFGYLGANKEDGGTLLYDDYEIDDIIGFKTAKESIQSACRQEYCIIFKK